MDPEWLHVTGLGSDVFGDAPTLPTKIPKTVTLMGLQPSALVIIAGSTKVHAKGRVARKARQRLPGARVETVRGASHYGLPMTHADQVAALMLDPSGGDRLA